MKYNFFIIFLTISLFSCNTCKNKDTRITEDNYNCDYLGRYIINEENTAGFLFDYDTSMNTEIVIARIPNDNIKFNGQYSGMLFKGEDNKSYYVYPRDLGLELERLSGCLVKFTVIILDEDQSEEGATRVTPISWEIIEEPPERNEPITLRLNFGISRFYIINVEGTAGTLIDYDNMEETKIIIGRIPRYSGLGPHFIFAVIVDENHNTHFIYPNNLGEALHDLSDRLVRFTVTIHYELVNDNIVQKVTPISWEIIEGPPVFSWRQ